MEGLTDEKPRVFITNYAGHDYVDAASYGEFEFITKGYVSMQSLDRLKYTIAEAVDKSRKQDWLLLSGKPLICVVSALVWFSIHDQIKLLVWDRSSKYRELIITKRNMNELLQVLGESGAIEQGG